MLAVEPTGREPRAQFEVLPSRSLARECNGTSFVPRDVLSRPDVPCATSSGSLGRVSVELPLSGSDSSNASSPQLELADGPRGSSAGTASTSSRQFLDRSGPSPLLKTAGSLKAHQSAAAAVIAACCQPTVRQAVAPATTLRTGVKRALSTSGPSCKPFEKFAPKLKQMRVASSIDDAVIVERESPKSVLDAGSALCSSTSTSSISPSSICSPDQLRTLSSGDRRSLTAAILHSNMDLAYPQADGHAFHAESLNLGNANWSLWEGMIKHKVAGATMTLFGASMPVPIDLIESFPATLFVAELLHLSQVKIDESVDVKCECSFPAMDASEGETIAKMSKMQMCVAIQLQDCRLHIIPRLRSQGSPGALCFMHRLH